MWSIAVVVLVVTGSVSCNTSCPDGKVCPDPSSVGPMELISPLTPQVQSDIVPVQSDDTPVDSSPYPYCDSSSYCPAGTKCCRHPAGYWTCCTYSNGVCCRDGLHCCPSGYRCDSTSSRCLRSDGLSYPFVEKPDSLMIKATKISDQVQSDIVPVQSDDKPVDSSPYPYCDSSSYCPAGTKCCRHPAGYWTCCTYSNGVCCRDGLHCCPSGYRCDSTSSRCLRSDGLSYPFVEKPDSLMIKATKISDQVQSDVVPVQSDDKPVDSSPYPYCDSSSYCPAGTKCCRHPAGYWTCCTYSNGVCCRDGLHCCPSGYRCDSTSSRCLRSDGLSYPFGLKQGSPMIKATKISN
uniref:Granulins domain-containing protein n=1 Tax=Esox lucius TaxID=8010 RepID=A0A6Q2WPD3_ESOLU